MPVPQLRFSPSAVRTAHGAVRFNGTSRRRSGAKRATASLVRTFALIVIGLFASAALGDVPALPTARYMPSEQEVLKYIADTIDWYRHLPSSQQIGGEATDLLFLEDNQPITNDIARLSFEFGKAVADIKAPQNLAGGELALAPRAGRRQLGDLAAAKSKLDANARDAANQLKALEQARRTAKRADRRNLDAQIADIRSRIRVLDTISNSYEELVALVRTATADPDPATNMAMLVENLERTIPNTLAATSLQSSTLPSDGFRGIIGLLRGVSTVAHKERVIDGVIVRTDGLIRSLEILRDPFVHTFDSEFSSLSLDSKNLDALQQQQSRMNSLVGQVQGASSAFAALTRQQILLNLYRAHLSEWRSEVRAENRAAWKDFSIHLIVPAAILVVLGGLHAMARRFVYTHVHEADTRQMVIVGEWGLFWVLVLVVVLSAFAFDPGSVATFFGLLAAGLAVGLHDVLLAIGGYLMIVRKFHVRVGDHVQIAGVTGKVTRLGLMQFELSEVDAGTARATGRNVFFANSYVFVSPATPLFRDTGVPTG